MVKEMVLLKEAARAVAYSFGLDGREARIETGAGVDFVVRAMTPDGSYEALGVGPIAEYSGVGRTCSAAIRALRTALGNKSEAVWVQELADALDRLLRARGGQVEQAYRAAQWANLPVCGYTGNSVMCGSAFEAVVVGKHVDSYTASFYSEGRSVWVARSVKEALRKVGTQVANEWADAIVALENASEVAERDFENIETAAKLAGITDIFRVTPVHLVADVGDTLVTLLYTANGTWMATIGNGACAEGFSTPARALYGACMGIHGDHISTIWGWGNQIEWVASSRVGLPVQAPENVLGMLDEMDYNTGCAVAHILSAARMTGEDRKRALQTSVDCLLRAIAHKG